MCKSKHFFKNNVVYVCKTFWAKLITNIFLKNPLNSWWNNNRCGLMKLSHLVSFKEMPIMPPIQSGPCCMWSMAIKHCLNKTSEVFMIVCASVWFLRASAIGQETKASIINRSGYSHSASCMQAAFWFLAWNASKSTTKFSIVRLEVSSWRKMESLVDEAIYMAFSQRLLLVVINKLFLSELAVQKWNLRPVEL